MTDDLVVKLRAGELWKAESWTEKGNRYRSVTYLNMFPGTIEAAADRIEELERHVELRDFFLVENGLWEKFAKGVEGKMK